MSEGAEERESRGATRSNPELPRGTWDRRICIGISSCLLGENVRYDGRHKHYPALAEELGKRFELIPVCPEVEVGMGVPRERVRLEGSPETPSMFGVESRIDWTERMNRYATQRADQLVRTGIAGFVLKKNSPSCGLTGAPVFDSQGHSVECGRGLFADALAKRLPLLPLEDEERLHDPGTRQAFIERVITYHRQVFGETIDA